jgi:hypothetical protein
MNIISHWLESVKQVSQINQAIEDLNEKLGTNYSYSRIYEFSKGLRPTPQKLLRAIYVQSLVISFQKNGDGDIVIKKNDINKLLPPKNINSK